jgi:hypothetical protein
MERATVIAPDSSIARLFASINRKSAGKLAPDSRARLASASRPLR